ncbi:MAG: hypothetical protein WAT92_16370 [Saprospiraceae bacterium]
MSKKYLWGFLLISSILIAIYLENRNRNLFKKEGIQVSGKILSIEKRRKGITTSEIVATVEYVTLKGKYIKKTVPSRKDFIVGNCYELMYLSSDDYFVKLGEKIICK